MEPGEGSAAPKATVALPGTDVNPAGRAPARLAVHCILATGGPGAAMFHAPFGRPRHPLGTFPCGKVPRPPAGGRNLPQEIDCLWMARKRCFLAFPVSQGVSPLRRRPKGFPVALWKPSVPLLRMGISTRNEMLPCFFRFTGGFASAEATKGLSDRPLETFGPLAADGNFHKKWIVPSHQSTAKSVPVRRFRLPGTLLFSCSSSATQRP